MEIKHTAVIIENRVLRNLKLCKKIYDKIRFLKLKYDKLWFIYGVVRDYYLNNSVYLIKY